jgi:membrane protein implicated in regulation of membrane protease activity
MLAAYLISLIVGGVLVAMSVLAGADHADHALGDAGGNGNGDAGHDGVLDAVFSWFPIASIRFWTFFAAFFGLTGTAMTVLDVAGKVPIAIAAVAVGYASGLVLTRVIRRMQRTTSDSSLGEADLVGATARVLLPVSASRPGKVRVHMKDRSVDFMAQAHEAAEIAAGENVLVVAAPREGHVVVARLDKLS